MRVKDEMGKIVKSSNKDFLFLFQHTSNIGITCLHGLRKTNFN